MDPSAPGWYTRRVTDPLPQPLLPPAPASEPRLQRIAAALAGSPWFWMVFIGLGIGLPIIAAVTRHAFDAVPVIGPIRGFDLVDQHERPLTLDTLRGRVWVGTVNCTRCPHANPLRTERLRRVQHRSRRAGDAFRIVTFTLDPEHDTPAVLADYGHANHASVGRWLFATGKPDEVRRAIVQIFGERVRDQSVEAGRRSVFDPRRANLLALVDGRQRLRGYYDSRLDEHIDRLLRDIGRLLNE